MFDVGFSELILLFIIGLLVLGPEKLPKVANKLGGWVGQARRMTRMLKRQIEDELEFSKVRETVNQPLSSMMDKPTAKPKPEPTDLNYEEGEDDESGFGETGHADAGDGDRAVPDPAAPPPPDGEETSAGSPDVRSDAQSPVQSDDQPGDGPGKPGAEGGKDSQKKKSASS
ncbi:MAG TPA: Sec-independent protein translocase protein TatB [Woeseiaceae bacterium]|nr:Sec-independent protein translocase protein TatB [Woeseiaceae bacterium]